MSTLFCVQPSTSRRGSLGEAKEADSHSEAGTVEPHQMRTFMITLTDALELGIGIRTVVFFVEAESPEEAEHYVQAALEDRSDFLVQHIRELSIT